jgi:hypothetical protein
MVQPRAPHIPDLRRIVQPVIDAVRARADSRVRTFAEKEATTFKQRIVGQDFMSFKQVPLNRRYLEWKAKHGLSTKTMIALGDYVKYIRAHYHVRQDGGLNVYIGHHPSLCVRDSRTGRTRHEWPMQTVAAIHEFGSANGHVPARPHWQPFYWGMLPRAAAVRAELRRHLGETIRAHNRNR